MSVYGVDLDTDLLVLTRGRDFKWAFDNVDPTTKEPVNFPAGNLFFELQTRGESNARQLVTVSGAMSGSYKLGFGGHNTSALNWSAVTTNPQNISGGIQSALEAVTGIGSGNVVVRPGSLVPVWQLNLTLNAGHNEVQRISFRSAVNGGSFKLALGTHTTTAIAFGASAAVVKSAIEALASVGSGNTSVTLDGTGYLVEYVGALAATNVGQLIGLGLGLGFGLTGDILPNKISTSTVVSGLSKLSGDMVNVLNSTINDFFNSFESVLGVNLNLVVTDTRNVTVTATSQKSYDESSLITFVVDVTSDALESFFNGVSTFLGIFDTINVDFYWVHSYEVEFVGALGLLPQPALTYDDSLLVGGVHVVPGISVEIEDPGTAPTTKWPFSVSGATATIKVENTAADQVGDRTDWQLVFLPSGEAAGGDPIGEGRVKVKMPNAYIPGS